MPDFRPDEGEFVCAQGYFVKGGHFAEYGRERVELVAEEVYGDDVGELGHLVGQGAEPLACHINAEHFVGTFEGFVDVGVLFKCAVFLDVVPVRLANDALEGEWTDGLGGGIHPVAGPGLEFLLETALKQAHDGILFITLYEGEFFALQHCACKFVRCGAGVVSERADHHIVLEHQEVQREAR